MSGLTNSEAELHRFIEIHNSNPSLQKRLYNVTNLDDINQIVKDISPNITAAIIPLEQASRPAKLVVDSGVMGEEGINWRMLKCTGGPLVIQMICKSINFALWIPAC